jgi:hypothetical protein
MGIFFGVFEYMFTTGCVLGMNFIFIFLFGLIRNLPGILRVARSALREIIILSYRAYKPVIVHLPSVVQRYCWVEIRNTPRPIAATILISILLLLFLDWLFGWNVSLFFIVLAILHGAIVGFLWDELDQGDDLRTGEKIE